MREIDYIVVHEADTPLLKPSGAEFTVIDIDQWHKERGFHRQVEWINKFNPGLVACGYHYVIGVRGDIWTGRHEDEIPAAVSGHNSNSINICLIGKGKYTSTQWSVLETLVHDLTNRYARAGVLGHCDFPGVTKTCPDFDVKAWYQNNMVPTDSHIAEI